MTREIKMVLVAVITMAVVALVMMLDSGCGSVAVGGSGVSVGVAAPDGKASREEPEEELPKRDRPLTEQQKQLNMKSFEYVWAKVHESLWPEILEEAGWDDAHLEFKPRIESASTMKEWRGAMMEMLERLRISHTQIIPSEAYDKYLADGTDGRDIDGETGISVRVIEGAAMVTAVREESAAWADGVRPGWILQSLGGKDVAEGLEELADVYEGHYLKDLTLASITQFSLTGDAGEDIEAVFLDGKDEQVEIDLIHEPKRGSRFEYGNLPPLYVWVDTMTVAGDIEVVGFNMFMDPLHLMPVFERSVKRAETGRGLIIDLRGNMGGMGAMASWLAGFLFEEKGKSFGTFRMKGTELNLIVIPRANAYTGPVAVLVDGLSLSAAEFFADGMQKTGRAKVFGKRTTGFALPSVIERLPNGDAVQYVHADYVNSEGERLEGVGVTPDFQVIPARSQLLEGRDPVLEAAIEWIRAEAGNS
jgi:carboxyl-terminal processing protease